MFKIAYIFKVLVIFAVYFITAKFGLTLDAVGGFATLVWLPTGISLSALLILGFRFWPAITLGAFFANLLTGAPILVAVGISIGNTLEALVAAFLLKKIVDFRNSLDSIKDVLGFVVVAAIFSTATSAFIGVSSLLFGKVITWDHYFNTWIAWWIGDMVSALVVAPFLLVWSSKPRSILSIRQNWEIILMILVILIISSIIFLSPQPKDSPRAYLVFPPLIWIALRFGQRGSVSATFVLSIITVCATAVGLGPFVLSSLSQSLLALQLFMGVLAVTGLTLGAVASERERLEERKDEFISIASHELKTPITTIKGYTEIISQYLKKAKDRKLLPHVFKMEEQLSRLTKLVNDLLDVSKIQSGKLSLQKERFRMDELIKEVIEDMQLTTNHKIIFEKDEKIPKVRADRYRISEVLTNLISNAIKYSPKADKIFVHLSYDDDLIISIQDFGIGISRKDKGRIFDRFFQANTKIRQSFQGLGLGLYISSQIIKRHGGSIWISSIKGKGSTVTFKLPLGRSNLYG